jgi:hypothetical protein
MEKASRDREPDLIPPKIIGTYPQIRDVRDPHVHVTEYVVEPGSTEIPYCIANHTDRPIDTPPGKTAIGMLGTPKLFEFEE